MFHTLVAICIFCDTKQGIIPRKFQSDQNSPKISHAQINAQKPERTKSLISLGDLPFLCIHTVHLERHAPNHLTVCTYISVILIFYPILSNITELML